MCLARIVTFGLCGVTLLTASDARQGQPTLRQALAVAYDLAQFDDTFLDSLVPAPRPGRRFATVGRHLSPSAEQLFVFSNTFSLVRELDGWVLVTLPNEAFVYQHSQVHFAPTHSLEISVFDPSSLIDTTVYPPAPASDVRRRFVQRVAKEYAARGEAWFREHNHHMDAERFDTTLMSDVTVSERDSSLVFTVHFGDPDNARDPLPFSERVRVTCTPLVPVERITCRETAIP